jgi:3-hydroxybutyryl-CoA dehydratase
MSSITNIPYGELAIGQSASMAKKITNDEVVLFGCLTGDANPVHFDSEYAKNTRFKTRIAHGMLSGSLISAVLGMQLPGTGTIYINQSLNFCYPVYIDDTITVTVTVTEKKEKNRVVLSCVCTNQNGKVVTEGQAEVIAPAEKITCQTFNLPKLQTV